MGLTAIRRYYRAKLEAAKQAGEEGLAGAFDTKLGNLGGTPLPEGFPARAKLEAARLRTLEDVQANLDNLRKFGLSKREVEAVRAALGA